jgi:hypothetical protein
MWRWHIVELGHAWAPYVRVAGNLVDLNEGMHYFLVLAVQYTWNSMEPQRTYLARSWLYR